MDSEIETTHNFKTIDAYSNPTLLASSSHTTFRNTDFFRACSLCVDGSAAMTERANRTIEIYDIASGYESNGLGRTLSPTRQFVQPGNILGTLWYPTAIPANPASFCFLASVRECPVKLLDASDGRLRASYKIVDHRERHIAPNSMSFSATSTKLYCGYQDAIEVFDINYPGEGERLLTTPSKKSKSGFKGIVSSLAFCPDYSGLYAAGTFSEVIALLSETSGVEIVQRLGGIEGPVTQIKFNPMRPHILYATSRQTNHIYSWDIRGDTSTALQKFPRPGSTNQRLYFDIDIHGKTMVTGDQHGAIRCFQLDGDTPEKTAIKFQAHQDAVAATAVHPSEPIVISVSGSRHFENDTVARSATGSESSESSNDDCTPDKQLPISKDTTVKLWKFSIREEINFPIEVYNSVKPTNDNA